MSDEQGAERRRALRFKQLTDLLEDAEQMASGAIRTSGSWSAGRIIHHVADGIHISIDAGPTGGGDPPSEDAQRRKAMVLARGLPEGVPQPAAIAERMAEDDVPIEDALGHLRAALMRLDEETMNAAHPVLGPLTPEEWVQFHCRHGELHFSFMHPAE